MSLKVDNLVGGYSRIPVLKDVSFDVKDGELVGLIGLNGAGKSTTINHVIGLLRPFSGSIKINGIAMQDDIEEYKKQIAYIPEFPVLYKELTLKEHIETTIKAYDLDEQAAWKDANKMLKMFRLENKLEWFPINFSKGMRQKVMILCAFITNAKLFVIDEPFLGLDPVAVNDLLNLIEEQKKKGSSILMSTHVLDTAERFCDRFVLIHNGQIRTEGNIEKLQDEFGSKDSSLNDIYLKLAKEEANE
ncbi:ABC-type transporter ATP-binding protein EcsA [Apilactobacillus kunkeei]|uniref:ABC transporter ATP-binding protein n=2 Tax=Apilactobacillus TaxID=2767877 RepID=A0A0M9DAE6_9LACO|nr:MULTISPECIES: ABC transporter ATP-binding protein [Apilactobacillus]MBV0914524.1 ABC transporter ATP-binding protein [Apilactobacillus waqarii]MCL8495969.1 ABC transporter ATP-binding protein [Apilactobacillus sp. F1]KOY74056.1 ABC transporter, ATP-binding protein EcsA [Apilactobacillus kunkeei]MDN2612212.1 ABC transporter ATP-binding protein [Apilactobacillus sp. EABW-1NA]CAI2590748.1 ABC-type transporter ATP-binding protein EcsA [Apilactobacillus kunkeei]